MDQDASDIPHFSLELAEALSATCASTRNGASVELGSPMFACHQSRPGEEVVCAGWLAVEGADHVGVRLNVISGHLDPSALSPGPGWPELHTCFQEVIEKLRSSAG